jgi:putative FmdB family regulatory protein
LPLYEYRCGKCGLEFDAWNSVAKRQTATCAKCGGTAEKRMSIVNANYGFRLTDKSLNDVDSKDPDVWERNV